MAYEVTFENERGEKIDLSLYLDMYGSLIYCPHCDAQLDDSDVLNGLSTIEKDEEVHSIDCPACGRNFDVKVRFDSINLAIDTVRR